MSASALGRLRKGPDFDGVYEQGIVVNGPLFVLRARANDLGLHRWGFAVGKRLAPRAVIRNRVRRRLREAARSYRQEPGFPAERARGLDIVITARSAALSAGLDELRAGVERAVGRASASVDSG